MIVLVTGGARSGKSTYAEQLAQQRSQGAAVLYIATAAATDSEMEERIKLHRERRPQGWRTVERYKALASIEFAAERVVLLDCVGFLLNNNLFERMSDSDDISKEEADAVEEYVKQQLSDIAKRCEAEGADLIIVTNEVGSGLVPATKLSRLYRDALGRINCHAAALADKVFAMVCGIAVEIK